MAFPGLAPPKAQDTSQSSWNTEVHSQDTESKPNIAEVEMVGEGKSANNAGGFDAMMTKGKDFYES